VESVAAIENLEQLIAHDGVDAVFLGPHDITCSMEIPEEYDNPQFVATVLDVIRRCRALGKGVGIHMDAVSDLCRPYLDAGMNFVLNAADATKMHARLNEDFRSLRARYGDPFRREEAGADGPKGCLVQAGPAKRKRTPAS
jgi:4-hydroxy-2-oxoheptanedioate aldolase